MTQLIWYRNDLRVSDHEALFQAMSAVRQSPQPCEAVFFWSEPQWRSHGAGDPKIVATLAALKALNTGLAELGIPLTVIPVSSWDECAPELEAYCRQHQVTDVHLHTEPGWNERNRDEKVRQRLAPSIKLHPYHDLYFIDPAQHLTQQHQVYRVFTAYKKSMMRQFSIDHLAMFPPRKAGTAIKPKPVNVRTDARWDNPMQLPVTEPQAKRRLSEFCSSVSQYSAQRDFPGTDGTSRLSAALALGCLSSRQIAHELHHHSVTLAADTFFSEIIWRDFYKYLLFHMPGLCLGHAYNQRWDQFPWRSNPVALQRWQEGKTGVPIVDAAMRQLLETGWMHNRLRMIAGMYLVKIMQQDWRSGEAWFAGHLADFDFAANNGGWQWVASTGVDAVPYFRIFSPYQQSKRFDPQGEFIRTYVRELRSIEAKAFHRPQALPLTNDYPTPIIDYTEARRDTLERFKALGRTPS